MINAAKKINDANPGANPLNISVKDVASKVIAEYIVDIVAINTEINETRNAVFFPMSICIGPRSKWKCFGWTIADKTE